MNASTFCGPLSIARGAAVLAAVLLALPAARALAQSPKIFVSINGNDGSAGTSVAPKRNFQAAHDAVSPGGEIVVLDTGGYGVLSINKSVTVTVPPGVNGFITAASGNGVTINASSSDVVVLRGLVIEGNNSGFGIASQGATGTVRVEDCTLRGFFTAILQNTTGSSHLIVRGCFLRDVSYGVGIASLTNNTILTGTITNTTVDAAATAALDADGSEGGVARLVASNCVLTNSTNGLKAETNGTACMDQCTVTGNTQAIGAFGGTLITRGNNTFFFNNGNGTFNSTQAAF